MNTVVGLHLNSKDGAPGRTRTSDTRFRKPLLYPLSYEGGWPRMAPCPSLLAAQIARAQHSGRRPPRSRSAEPLVPFIY